MPTETEHTDSKHEDLRSLRIDHSLRDGGGEPHAWSRRFILGGITVVVLLGLALLAYRLLSSDAPEVEVARATAEGSDVAGSTVLSASGYIVAHHKISVNSKVTVRVALIGVGKGGKGKGRQCKRRTSAGTAGGSGIPSSIRTGSRCGRERQGAAAAK